ncbi:MAG: AMP-binding protein [Promethearchaeota archaeon]
MGKGKLTTKKSGNGGYKSVWVYIPSKICKDDTFPFQDNEDVLIEIEEDTLVISKSDERSTIIRNFGIDNATLPKLLEIKATEKKDLPFLYFKDQVFSYQAINENANQIAHGIRKILGELQLQKPKISLIMNNCPEFIFTWAGIIKADCIVVPVHTTLKEDCMEQIIANSDTEIVIIDFRFLNKLDKILKQLTRVRKVFVRNAPENFTFNGIYQDFQQLRTSNKKNPKINIVNQDPVEILYSEGSNGKQKGIIYRNVVLPGIVLGLELGKLGLNQGDTLYCPFPLSQIAAHFYGIIPALFYDIKIIIAEKFEPSSFWEDVKRYNPTGFCYFGGYLTELLFHTPNINDRSHSLKMGYGFGASLSKWNSFEKRFGISLHECWSQIEGIGVTINRVGSKGGKIGSIGTPLDFIELKIVDSERNEVFPNIIGEIAARRKSQNTFEYYKHPEKEDIEIGEDGWVYTGDYGYIDFDGFLYYKGRRNEFLQLGGETIYLRDITNVVNSHPHIIESTVIPVANGSNSKQELKIVAVKVKNKDVTYEELGDFMYHSLAYFHVPRYIEFIEELPKGAATDILKSQLKNDWENGLSQKDTWDLQMKKFVGKKKNKKDSY